MAQRIQLRRDSAADWTAANPILASGEVGVETDTGELKIGDGVTAWASLGYFASGGGGDVASVNGATGVVVLDADDIDDTSTTQKFVDAAAISKLAGIEASADVTDATNVAAAGAIMGTLIDAKGDLIVGTAADTAAKLPVSTDGFVLTADSSAAAGVKWGSPIGAIIDEEVLSADATSISFTSIPSTYAHLVMIYQARSNLAGVGINQIYLQFNGDTSSLYNTQYVGGNNASAIAGATNTQTAATLGYISAATATAGLASAGVIEIPNYKGTTFFKSGTSRLTRDENSANANMVVYSSQFYWRSTAAINRVDLILQSGGQFLTGSRFTLYGIMGLS